MRRKYKSKFERLFINNRWKQKKYMRNSDWVVFGLSQKYFSPTEYSINIHLFGIDFRFWFKKIY